MKIGYVKNVPIFGAKEKNFEEVRSLLDKIKADNKMINKYNNVIRDRCP